MGSDSSMPSCGKQDPLTIKTLPVRTPPGGEGFPYAFADGVTMEAFVEARPAITPQEWGFLRGLLPEYRAKRKPSSWPGGEPQKIRDAADQQGGKR